MFTKKFEWIASESAPMGYPMTIIGGSLIYNGGSQYIPSGSDIETAWGRPISSHASGEERKPPPRKLAITFFSYHENQFYEGTFELPYEKILKLLQEGYYSPNEGGHVTYHEIVTGVAPGGAVTVWLLGYNRTTEVFHGTAEKVDLPWSALTSATHITREEYVRSTLEYSRGYAEKQKHPEALAAWNRKGIPFGLWDSYRTRYNWQPLFTGMTIRDGRIDEVRFFSGELDYINYPLDKVTVTQPRAVPRQVYFIWEMTPATGRSIEITFDETEVFEIFKKLGANNQPLKLEMKMEVVNGNNMFTVALRNDKERIEFDKIKVEHYAVRDRQPAKAK